MAQKNRKFPKFATKKKEAKKKGLRIKTTKEELT
jgi:hypothetical protein